MLVDSGARGPADRDDSSKERDRDWSQDRAEQKNWDLRILDQVPATKTYRFSQRNNLKPEASAQTSANAYLVEEGAWTGEQRNYCSQGLDPQVHSPWAAWENDWLQAWSYRCIIQVGVKMLGPVQSSESLPRLFGPAKLEHLKSKNNGSGQR